MRASLRWVAWDALAALPAFMLVGMTLPLAAQQAERYPQSGVEEYSPSPESLSESQTDSHATSLTEPLPACGTLQTESDLVWLRELQRDPAFRAGRYSHREGLQYVRVQAHLVSRDNFMGAYRIQLLLESICRLNEQYAETGFYFYLQLPLRFHQSDSWWNQNFSDGVGMMLLNNVPGALNVYYVSSIQSGTVAGYFSPGADGVAMAISASAPSSNVLAHEFGHFFSLPHTFFGWEGGTPSLAFQERVDGSNCNTAADGFCDTPPDYAAYRWNCPQVGPFTDPAGEEFVVTDSFYMSYAGNACMTRFSEEQMAAMRANLNGPRTDLIGTIEPYFPDGYDSVRLLVPPDQSELVPPRGQRFRWSSVPGAVGYHVSFAYNSLFTGIAEESIVLDTAFTALRLPQDRQLFWRVKPLFAGNTCEPYSPVFRFRTGDASSSPISGGLEPDAAADLTLSPNPVQAGNRVRLNGLSGNNPPECFWLDAQGRQSAVSGLEWAPSGFALQAPAQPGVYVLIIRDRAGNTAHRRVIATSGN